MFYVGQKVVCINDQTIDPKPGARPAQLDGITRGRVYTIRHVSAAPFHGIRLVEIFRCQPRYYGGGYMVDLPYDASRFRPVVERKTDISIFHRILRDASKNVEA